jgi:DNA-binding NarL/FixJ family response regulator
MAVSQAVALRGPGRLALEPPAALLGLAFAAASQSRGRWTCWPRKSWQIARLAAEGLSNQGISQQLYLSHRTVRSHLYWIFPKLGITSRAELAAVVGASPGPV